MPPSSAAPPRSAAIVLVGDRREALDVLESALAPLADEGDARLLRAASAEEALESVLQEDGTIAAVVLDVMRPGTDVLEAARLIRARRSSEHLPIIFVTALDEDRRQATLGYQFGAVDYLIQPLDPEVLRTKVRALITLHRRRGEELLHERRRYADELNELREAALRDETTLIATIQRIGSALASELDLERVVQLVTDEATELTGAQFGAFFYKVQDPTHGREEMTLYALAGVPREHFADFPHPRATPVFGPTFRGEGVVRSGDITRDPRYGQLPPHYGMPPGHLPVRSYLAMPVRSRTGDVLGGLFFGHELPDRFGEREERLVAGVASWGAVAMDNARLYAGERRAREEAEAAARTKTEFLATMSHEFRTPLNAVLGYAQLLELGVLGPNTAAQQTHLGRLQASARHLLGLIDDVLDVARIDADRLAVRHDVLRTGQVVAAAVAVVQPEATIKGVRLIDLGDGDAGVPYLGDEHRVRQVMVNLLANAVKFTPPGGEVTVTCGSAAEPEPGVWTGMAPDARPHLPDGVSSAGAWAFIRVADTGPGIAPDLLVRLFEPFVQGDGALTRQHGGTGLGLAISRRLARLMDGDLVARSQAGGGATFTLWLRSPTLVGSSEAPAVRSSDDFHRDTAQNSSRSNARRTPASLDAMSEVGPLDAVAYTVLHALAVRLASGAETVAENYIAALRADGRFPGARELPSVQIRDHATPFVGLIAAQLMITGETRGEAPQLLSDGAQVQRVMAELHGAQRHRLGWSESDLEREGPILGAQIEHALRAAVDTALSDDAVAGVSSGPKTSSEAVRAASRYAIIAARQMIEQAGATAVRAYRFAKATSTP